MRVLILVADGFNDLQLFYPWFRLREEGFAVTIATPAGQAVTGQHGYKVEADMPVREINPGEYSLLVIPGGQSPEKLRLRESAVDIARTFMDQDRPVATLGHGPQLLISAYCLTARQLTSCPAIRDDIRAVGGIYRDDPYVVDNNLISGRGADDLPDFCRSLLSVLRVSA